MVNLYANIDLVEINTLFAFLTLDMIHDFHSTLSKTSGWGQEAGPLDFRIVNGGRKKGKHFNKTKKKRRNNKRKHTKNIPDGIGKLEYELLLEMSPFLTKIFNQYSGILKKSKLKSKKTLKKTRSKVFEEPISPNIYGGMDGYRRTSRNTRQPDQFRPDEEMHQPLDPQILQARRAARRARMIPQGSNWNPSIQSAYQQQMARDSVDIINNMLTSLSEVWINLIDNSVESIFKFDISNCGSQGYTKSNYDGQNESMKKLEELLEVACSGVQPEEPIKEIFLDESWEKDGEQIEINTEDFDDSSELDLDYYYASNGNQVNNLDRGRERCYLSQKLDSGCRPCNHASTTSTNEKYSTMKENVNILLETKAPDEYNKLNITLSEATQVPGTGTTAPMTGLKFLINNIEIESEFYHINGRKPTINSVVMVIYEYLIYKVNEYIRDNGLRYNLIEDFENGGRLTLAHYRLLYQIVSEENNIYEPGEGGHLRGAERSGEIVRSLLGRFLSKAAGDLSIELEILLSGNDNIDCGSYPVPSDENYDQSANNMIYITEDRLSFVRFCYLNNILHTCFNKSTKKHAILSSRQGNHIISPVLEYEEEEEDEDDGTGCRRLDGECYTYQQVLDYYGGNDYQADYYWTEAGQEEGGICDYDECYYDDDDDDEEEEEIIDDDDDDDIDEEEDDGTGCRRLDGECYTYQQVLDYYGGDDYQADYYWTEAGQEEGGICDYDECYY